MPISKLAVAISEVPAAWHKFHVKFGGGLNRSPQQFREVFLPES